MTTSDACARGCHERKASVTRDWCPGCEPDIDPSRELVDTKWCVLHKDKAHGVADAAVPDDIATISTGGAWADGVDNRAIQAVIR